METLLKYKNLQFKSQEIGTFSEGYALAKVKQTSDNKHLISTNWVVIDENNQIVDWVDDFSGLLVTRYEARNENFIEKCSKIKETAQLGEFNHGIAKIKVLGNFTRVNGEKQSVERSYYVSRSGLLLTTIDENNLNNNKKAKANLDLAEKIWNNPDKFRSIAPADKVKDALNIVTIRALYDIANHSLDAQYKKAEKDLEDGVISQKEFDKQTNKILSTVEKNEKRMTLHESRSGSIECSHAPIRSYVENVLENQKDNEIEGALL